MQQLVHFGDSFLQGNTIELSASRDKIPNRGTVARDRHRLVAFQEIFGKSCAKFTNTNRNRNHGSSAISVQNVYTTIASFLALDIPQPDVAMVGDITSLRRIATLAQEHNLTFTPHNRMGVAANAHLVAGFIDAPFLEFPFDPPEWSCDRRDCMMAEPLRPDKDGWTNLSDTLGMGYALDEDRLKATRVG